MASYNERVEALRNKKTDFRASWKHFPRVPHQIMLIYLFLRAARSNCHPYLRRIEKLDFLKLCQEGFYYLTLKLNSEVTWSFISCRDRLTYFALKHFLASH